MHALSPQVTHLAVEHAMLLTARDDLVSRLAATTPGSVDARSCIGQIVNLAPLSPSSPLGVWARGGGEVDPQWASRIPVRDDSLASQLEFLSLIAPPEVLAAACPYQRLEGARAWAASLDGPAGPSDPEA